MAKSYFCSGAEPSAATASRSAASESFARCRRCAELSDCSQPLASAVSTSPASERCGIGTCDESSKRAGRSTAHASTGRHSKSATTTIVLAHALAEPAAAAQSDSCVPELSATTAAGASNASTATYACRTVAKLAAASAVDGWWKQLLATVYVFCKY